MSDNEVSFTPEERAYFETGGESLPQPKESIEPEPALEAEGSQTANEPEVSEEKQDDKQKFVPHQALHAERMKRQALERQLQETAQRFQTYEQRMQEINDLLQPKQAAPDPEQDPIGALKYNQEKLEAIQNQQREAEKQRMEMEREQAFLGQIDGSYKQSWASKLSGNPDLANAYKSFISALDGHFQLRGVADPQQRQALIISEERAIAHAALQRGMDPAEAVIQQAKLYGYQPKQQQPDPVKTIEAKQNGLAAARSLSNAGGGGSDDALSPARLAEMSTEEFAALKARLSPSKFAKLMGGV